MLSVTFSIRVCNTPPQSNFDLISCRRNKSYDGTTADTITGKATLSGVVSGDDVSSASFADPTVGSSKSVTFSGYAVSGPDASNYVVTQPASSTADITMATTTTILTAQTGREHA